LSENFVAHQLDFLSHLAKPTPSFLLRRKIHFSKIQARKTTFWKKQDSERNTKYLIKSYMPIKLHGLGKSNKKRIKEIGRELKKLEPVQIGTIIWPTLY
jgi:hypothetical protein